MRRDCRDDLGGTFSRNRVVVLSLCFPPPPENGQVLQQESSGRTLAFLREESEREGESSGRKEIGLFSVRVGNLP
jgi:hypothetical protein